MNNNSNNNKEEDEADEKKKNTNIIRRATSITWREIILEEAGTALKNMKNGKSPGTDGFGADF